ncbi:MAG: ABC transporter permease subunit [Tuberibacillus sp.]
MRGVTLRFTIQFIITILMAFLLGSLPYMFFDMKGLMVIKQMLDSGELNNTLFLGLDPYFRVDIFFNHVCASFMNLFHLSTVTYYAHGIDKKLFPMFFDKYLYSIRILIASLGLAFCFSILLTMLIMMSPQPAKRVIKTVIQAIQSIPDIFYLILFQILVITIYSKTHFLLFEIAQYDQRIYALPIIILTILPTLQMTQILILNFEDEMDEPYVEFAVSKGLKKWRVLFIHIFRNALASFLTHLKTIFWFALSNLIMVEVLLNMDGFVNFLFEYGPLTPDIMSYGLIMLVVPFLIIFFIAQQVVNVINNSTESGAL